MKAACKILWLLFWLVLPAVLFAAQVSPPYPTTFWVAGEVIGPPGAAADFDLTGYRVLLYLKNADGSIKGFADALTDAQGNFLLNAHEDLRLLPLQAGVYFIRVDSPAGQAQYGVAEKEIQIGPEDLQNGFVRIADPAFLTLAQGQYGTIRGIVASNTQPPQPIDGASLSFISEFARFDFASGGDGIYAIDVPAGIYRGSARKPDFYQPQRIENIVVVAGEVTEVNFSLNPMVVLPPGGIPEGTVLLTIVREGDAPGSNIIIGWQGDTPDIWYLTGDGEGRYTVDVNGWVGEDGVGHPWVKVLDGRGGVLEAGMAADFELNVGQRRLKHRDQVGEADQDREVYYKGFVAGTVPGAVHPEGGTFISQAVAVGKINVVLDKEWNLVGIPFEVAENLDAGGNNLGNLNNVLGRGIFARDDQVWVYDRGFKSSFFDGAGWPTNISLTKGRGFWLKMAREKTLSLAGQVFRDDFAKEIAGGWNLLASPYPAVFDISEATSGLNAPARDDQIWWYKRGFRSEAAAGDPVAVWAAGKTIIPGAGFWYKRNIPQAYNWQMSLP